MGKVCFLLDGLKLFNKLGQEDESVDKHLKPGKCSYSYLAAWSLATH